MEDRVLIKENWSEISSISEQWHCGSHSRATSSKKNLIRPVARKQKYFYFGLSLIFCAYILPQWLPVIFKKVYKWVLYLVVIKNYYRNLRIVSLTLKICVSITFNIAVTMVRYSGSRLNIFIKSLRYILKSFKEAHRFRISFNLELY